MLQLIVSVSNSINAVNCSFEYVVQVQFSLLFQDIQDEQYSFGSSHTQLQINNSQNKYESE